MMSLLSLSSIMKFFSSPLGIVLAGVIAFAGWTSYQRNDAAKDATIACEQKHQAAALKELDRQERVAQEALKQALADKERIDKELKKIEELANEIRIQSTGACILDADTIKRLSDIK